MDIVIGADHRGFVIKNEIQQHIRSDMHITWLDIGCFSVDLCDYPLIAQEAVMTMRAKNISYGVLLCGTGAGMAIAANRFAGIYAALVWTEELARKAREHDNANILVLPADYINAHEAIAMIQSWLSASFAGGRHQRRIEEIDACEGV